MGETLSFYVCNRNLTVALPPSGPTPLPPASVGPKPGIPHHWALVHMSISGRLQIGSVKLDAPDPRLFHMLGEISSEEDSAGRGMLTVLVVHKVGDMQPGPGFFELAKQLGRDTTNKLK